ncbi:hypothetical protein Gpo141_00004153 [Globisporangium polare]
MGPTSEGAPRTSATATVSESAGASVLLSNGQVVGNDSAAFRRALQVGDRQLILQFAGQGLRYWSDLRALYQEGGAVRVLLDQAADALKEESSGEHARSSGAFERVFELKKWVTATEEELLGITWERAFFSSPLIALTQAARYLSFLASARLRHEDVMESTSCAIGHSQGVVMAAACAAAKSTSEFCDMTVQATRYMFWHGLRAQEAFDEFIAQDPQAFSDDDLSATPMLAIRGLKQSEALDAIRAVTRRSQRESVQISLVNAVDLFCVTGLPASLLQLKQVLESTMAKPGEDQTRVPFSQRKPAGTLSFVSVSSAFHSSLLASARELILSDVERLGLRLTGAQLQVPVYSTTSETVSLQSLGDANVLLHIVDMQLTQLADWVVTMAAVQQQHSDATHVLDFGPGAGVARLSSDALEGFGIQVVTTSSTVNENKPASSRLAPITSLSKFLDDALVIPACDLTWESKFGTRVDASGQLVNKFTRALKKPPVLVAGMNPTTSLAGVDLVAAIMNAGFYGELASGGLHRPEIFNATINELVSKVRPGHGIAINMIYINTKTWAFQYPMVLRLRKSGIPIESITIGAGIPTPDRSKQIMADLFSVGINVVGFKPGSADGIYSVLEIALANPLMTVMLQWTGGRAGGHHSFEDFHAPLAATYAAIRRVANVLLVVGSGFGNWEDSYPYLTGEWAIIRGISTVRMPVDAILLGSRVMVAKEAATADEVKQLLVDTPGIESEFEWEQSYKGPVGGIITVISEHGQPIHTVANRCTLLWKEFDDKYFSHPREEMERALRLDKKEIIARVNADFQKLYFGTKRDPDTEEGRSAELHEMTYAEVLSRLVELMFANHPGRSTRWIHHSYANLVEKFIRRVEACFQRQTNHRHFNSRDLITSPQSVLERFTAAFPQTSSTLMSIPDCDYLLELCRSNGKPVNFIPIIDGDFRTWFTKDSLWYSEDLDAVPERDVQRVCILQGPVAVRYSTKVNEPTAKILGDIVGGYTKVVAASSAIAADEHNVKAPRPTRVAGYPTIQDADGSIRVALPHNFHSLPSLEQWLDGIHRLASGSDWLAALISSKFVVEGTKWVANPIRELLQPQRHQTLVVRATGLQLFDSSLPFSEPAVQIFRHEATIVVRTRAFRPGIPTLKQEVVSLDLNFGYFPETSCPIHAEDWLATEAKIKTFYAKFCAADDGNEEESCAKACATSISSSFTEQSTITADDIAKYTTSLRLDGDSSAAPVDFAAIVGWRTLVKPLMTREVTGNLLSIVHLKHASKLLARPATSSAEKKTMALFAPGDDIVSVSRVSGVRIIESGKVISCRVLVSRKTRTDSEKHEALEPLVELQSDFLIRGSFSDFASTFSTETTSERVTLRSAEDVHVLSSMHWFVMRPDTAPPAVSEALEFRLTTKKQHASMHQLASISVIGTVNRLENSAFVSIADVKIESEALSGSPVDDFLQQMKQHADSKLSMFPNGGCNLLEKPIEVQVPSEALTYATASRDLNPIHRSAYAAILGRLPGGEPVMHGMWTAAKARSLVVKHFGSGVDTSVVSYDVSFDGKVYPGDKWFFQARHIGQRDGKKVLSVEVANEAGERVLTVRAEIQQLPTVFVFTGQGSAQVGMGMELYHESPIAREIWSRGERHLRERFGFSILEIVQKNPKTIAIHFGGLRGHRIRENLMQLKCEDPETGALRPLLPDITERSQSFTFSREEGLLFLTQFSQPALVLFETAAFAEIQAANLVPEDALFAGHSLGEYAGLCAFAGALPIENVVEVVFLRGLIMQQVVQRDALGRSEYGMVAVDPSRVGGSFFTAETLDKVVDQIATTSGELLQVVNFNVQGRQYVVAGDKVNLEALSTSLSVFKSLHSIVSLASVVSQTLGEAKAKREQCHLTGEPFVLTRGAATTPLAGIDVPFHSRKLLGGVPAFRKLVRANLSAEVLERQLPLLVNRYIPNLVGTPFSLERVYFELVYRVTQSPSIAAVLDPKQWKLTTQAEKVHLLVCELFAYQFASPVQWIQTQALMFSVNGTGVTRFVEIGPAPTLTNMARQTLQVGRFPKASREILWYQRDRARVHFDEENVHPSATEYARALAHDAVVRGGSPQAIADTAVAAAPSGILPPPQPVSFSQPAPSSPASLADAPVSALHVLRALLATRLNRPLEFVSPTTDIKALCGGKSAVQNEIVGDLETEFGGGVPDNAADLPLSDLASQFPGYSAPGKVATGLVFKMVTAKMPGGVTLPSIKAHLSNSRGLGPGRTSSVLVHSLLSTPPVRLKSEREALEWIDSCVDAYAAFAAKFGKPLSEISDATTIKTLAAGKSAVQNEIVGDLESEFGSSPDDAADLTIAELSSKFTGYSALGKVASGLIAKLLASKMPGGFGLSAVKEHLARERGLPAGRTDSVLLHTLSHNPKQRVADVTQAKQWLDQATDDYAKLSGIEIPYLSRRLSGASEKVMPQQISHSASMTSGVDSRVKTHQVNALNEVLLDESTTHWQKRVQAEVRLREQIEASVLRMHAEHGEDYTEGVTPMFDARKERQYDSFWNWAAQDAIEAQFQRAFAPLDGKGMKTRSRLEQLEAGLCNRATPQLLNYLQYCAQRAEEQGKADLVDVYGKLTDGVETCLQLDPVYRPDLEFTKPQVCVLETGEVEYSEVPRGGVSSAIEYVAELARGLKLTPAAVVEKPQFPASQQLTSSLHCGEMDEFLRPIVLPHVHIRKMSAVDPTLRFHDIESTRVLLTSMCEMASTGVSFVGRVALVTGCGKSSIGAEVVKALLQGGATVFATTSSFGDPAAVSAFQSIYEQNGSRGSRLVVLPCNQASKQDVESLVNHIYDVHQLDLDFVVPFAAVSEISISVEDIEARSEVAHRLMLTNVLRLLGGVVSKKKALCITTRPATVILPLSSNRGAFGGDGLYAESKLGMESLLGKWCAETWREQLSVVGAVIGWTRSTGLMASNNDATQGFEEKLGVRTFSTAEMGFNVAALLHSRVVHMAAHEPLWADLTGGLAQVWDLKRQTDLIRGELTAQAKLHTAVRRALEREKSLRDVKPVALSHVTPRANLSRYLVNTFPDLSNVNQVAATREQQLLDLRKVVVVAGYGEIGPWGSARTRWEMESYGEFSLEGCVELAWLTGRIVYERGYWMDAQSREVVADHDIKARYESEILQHAGIRVIEPELFEGYDPHKKVVLHQVAIDKPLPPIEVADFEEAQRLLRGLGEDNADVFRTAAGAWMVQLKQGSVISVPRALSFDRFVAGQIPTGWSAQRLGLPKDIADSVDPITLYSLASTVEALVSAGVTDPYEFYQYIHVSEIGNTSGGGIGGMRALKRIFNGRLQGQSLPSDILQEAFINVAPAWVNMLLLSSSGPIKTPVGACATSAESVDIGVETIKSGKARVVIVGGYDDFGEEGSFEFAQMKATSDAKKETAMGREPREMCRPCSSTRGGFMESQGAGMQLLMDAQLALDMGCPIYGIVALTNTATDKTGRSVPAPGQGILTTVREAIDALDPECPLLDIEFRMRQFNAEVADIETWYSKEQALLLPEKNRAYHIKFLEDMKTRKLQAAQATWGEGFFIGRTDIAPIRGALAVWNLSIDDIGVASFHGTGTKANDVNESDVTQQQMAHLGRSAGNLLPVICQKNLTGHSKGAAAAWMANGLLQVLNTGVIPGNPHLDNTCGTLRQFDYLVYPNRSIQTTGIKAAVMKSFGFGQAGGEILLVHPDCLLSALANEDLASYTSRRDKRLAHMNAHLQNAITGKSKLIQVKEAPPYTSTQQSRIYLDPTARAQFDPITESWRFEDSEPKHDQVKRQRALARVKKQRRQPAGADPVSSPSIEPETQHEADAPTLFSAMRYAASSGGSLGPHTPGLGIDVEPVATFENLHGREDFIRRNFTDQEATYCYSAAHPAASFAGRWAAKEAVIKAISSAASQEPNVWKGAGAALREIEIIMTPSGAPSVALSGHALQAFTRLGLKTVSVSMSHSGEYAAAQALAYSP